MKDLIMTDRQFTEDTLVIATHNAGKMREISALFSGFDVDILSATDQVLQSDSKTIFQSTGNSL